MLCPNCKKEIQYNLSNSFRPFCGSACKNNDLIAWADESFKISSPLTDDEEDENQDLDQNGSSGDSGLE